MSKAYIQYKADLADAAAIDAYCLANPTQFTIGTIVVAANGDSSIVIDTTGNVGIITVT